jgi:hypothetical protein
MRNDSACSLVVHDCDTATANDGSGTCFDAIPLDNECLLMIVCFYHYPSCDMSSFPKRHCTD